MTRFDLYIISFTFTHRFKHQCNKAEKMTGLTPIKSHVFISKSVQSHQLIQTYDVLQLIEKTSSPAYYSFFFLLPGVLLPLLVRSSVLPPLLLVPSAISVVPTFLCPASFLFLCQPFFVLSRLPFILFSCVL